MSILIEVPSRCHRIDAGHVPDVARAPQRTLGQGPIIRAKSELFKGERATVVSVQQSSRDGSVSWYAARAFPHQEHTVQVWEINGCTFYVEGFGRPELERALEAGVLLDGPPSEFGDRIMGALAERHPRTQGERIAEWFTEQTRLAYPDEWESFGDNGKRGRVWACILNLAEFQELAGPIFRDGCPSDAIIERIADALPSFLKARETRRQAEEAAKAEAEERRQSEAATAMTRRVLAEAAERFEQTRATFAAAREGRANSMEGKSSTKAWDHASQQAEEAQNEAESSLAYRIDDALHDLVPEMRTHDEDGQFAPVAVAVGRTLYALLEDVGDMRVGMIAAVPLDRIIGLS